jgi:hypothetical protein
MKPYILEIISPRDVCIWKEVRDAIEKLPDDLRLGKKVRRENIVISCHMLARAVGEIWNMAVVDGYFDTHFEHSWCKTINGNIIDVYPVGILGGPLLVDGRTRFAKTAYSDREVSKTTKRQFKSKWFAHSVQIIEECLRTFKTTPH